MLIESDVSDVISFSISTDSESVERTIEIEDVCDERDNSERDIANPEKTENFATEGYKNLAVERMMRRAQMRIRARSIS